MMLKALDLFCGAGGVAMGLVRAGFQVTGIDITPQPRYPFNFIQGDALVPPVDIRDFDFVWASPVCKKYTRAWRGLNHKRENYPDQIPAVRRLLLASGVPFVIENVLDAPIRPDLCLTGAMFNLPLVRTRVFEIHGFPPPFLLSQQHVGTTRAGDLAMVCGHGGAMKGWNIDNWNKPEIRRKLLRRNSKAGWQEALGIDWMLRDEMAQAIPPAYSEFLGRAVMDHLAPRQLMVAE